MKTANKALELFESAKSKNIIWATLSMNVAAEYIINEFIGDLKRVSFGNESPTIDFKDGSLIVFKRSTNGFYAQYQLNRA